MPTIHVKHGIEFRKELYNSHNRKEWIQAAGAELEKKGVSLTLGEGSQARTIDSAAALQEFYNEYQSNPSQTAQNLGLQPGRDIQRYISDLVQAVDDIVKDTSRVKSGDTIDLSPRSDMGKMLGLDDPSKRYASSRTQFGSTAPAQGTTSVLGAMLSRNAIPADPLDGQIYMDATTFADSSNMASGRKSTEFEAVRSMTGLDKADLMKLLRTERGGRPILKRIRKAKDAEAFSVGYRGVSLNEMRWDSKAHKIREANPFISLTVEPGRLEADEKDGQLEVELGTDFNEDAYYDTNNFALLDNDMSVRARIRRDDAVVGPDGVRRVLIQSKIGSDVDASGMKHASKADIRKDRPDADVIEGLDDAVRSGLSPWGSGGWGSSGDEPIEALGLVHAKLSDLNALPDIGEHEDVMQLETKAHVRSTRSRFHFNETSRYATQDFFKETGEPKIKQVLELASASTSLDAGDKEKLQKLGDSLLDKSIFVDRCKEKLAELDPSLNLDDINTSTIDSLWPTQSLTRNKLETKKRRVVADAIKGAYDEFSGLTDDLRKDISGAKGSEIKDFALTETFIEFMKEKDENSRSLTTVQPFIKRLDSKLSGPDKDAFIKEFSEWATDKGEDVFSQAADKDLAFASLRKNMVNEELDIAHRQIEASGTAGETLWFDNARAAYTGNNRTGSNFLIDTFDVSEFYTPEAWKALTPEEKAGMSDIDADKMFHATVINEVQIELGLEEPFIEAKEEANTALSNAKAGLFMDYTLAQGLDVSADKPDSFETLVGSLQGKTADEQTAFIKELNGFIEAQGSPLSFKAADLGEFNKTQFTTNHQGQDAAKHPQLVDDVEMSGFVWDKMLGMQDYIADLRGRRVKKEAERAGFDVGWGISSMSKGDTALSLIKEAQH